MAVRCIALDVGTSVVKAVAFDGARAARVARRSCEVSRPSPGRAEQDMDEVWRAVVDTVREASQALDGVDVLAVTAQGDGLWPVTSDGRPTGPAVLWNDARATDVVRRWQESGLLERAYDATGSMSFAGLANALLTWFDEHDPHRLDDCEAALTCGGYIMARMTGELVTDASAPFLDLATGEWSDELLTMFDLGARRLLLPTVLADDDRSRPLTAPAADELGVDAGIPVVLAPYDVMSCTLGSGAVQSGASALMLGTTLCTTAVMDRRTPVQPPYAGLRLRSGLPERDVRVLPTLAGVGVLGWMSDLLGVGGPAGLTELAEKAEAGCGGLVVLPYLSPSGERAPFFDTDARGTVLGTTFDHGRDELARATFEGLAHVVRECLDAVGSPVEEVVVSGGGSRNRWWTQVLADATGCPVVTTDDEEVGARGAQVAALVQLGQADDHESAVEQVVLRRDRVEPGPDRDAAEAAYQRWVTVRDAVRPAWREART